MVNWLDRLRDPFEAVEHGVREADVHYRSIHTGPLTFDQIDYPAAQVYAEELSRRDGSNWTHSIAVNLYFLWDNDLHIVDDVYHPLAAVLNDVLAALENTERTKNYIPQRIDFFSGEPNADLVLAVSVQFQIDTVLDPSEFGT